MPIQCGKTRCIPQKQNEHYLCIADPNIIIKVNRGDGECLISVRIKIMSDYLEELCSLEIKFYEFLGMAKGYKEYLQDKFDLLNPLTFYEPKGIFEKRHSYRI